MEEMAKSFFGAGSGSGLSDAGPVDGRKPLLLQVAVGLREVAAAEEAAVGRQGRGVWGGEDEVLAGVDEGFLGDGIAAPEQEDESVATGGEFADGGIGELLPAVALVRACLVGADGEGGVEQQHPLVGPSGEVARSEGDGGAEVAVDLLDDVDQRRRHGDAVGDGEAEAHGLPGFVVGVLPEDDDLHLVERRVVEGVEYLAARRIAGVLLPFGDEELLELGEVGRLKLRLQHGIPTGVYFYCHDFFFF